MKLAEEVVNELPMDAMWFGLLALAVFALLLGVMFAFRSAAHRHDPAAFVAHGSTGAQGTTGSH